MKVDDQLIVFPFKDERWVGKFVVGGVLAFCGRIIPLFFIPISGYTVRVIRHTLKDGTPSLPDWDDWGDLILSGLKAWLIFLVYSLPLLIAIFCAYGGIFGGVAAFFIGAAEESAWALGGIFLAMVGFFAFGIVMIVMFPTFFFIPLALTRLAAYDSLGRAFQFGEIWREVKAGFSRYLLAFVVYLAVSMAASLAVSFLRYTVCLACLYPFALGFALVYSGVMQGTLYGLAYRETLALEGGDEADVAKQVTEGN
jgi:hypothetical protein